MSMHRLLRSFAHLNCCLAVEAPLRAINSWQVVVDQTLLYSGSRQALSSGIVDTCVRTKRSLQYRHRNTSHVHHGTHGRLPNKRKSVSETHSLDTTHETGILTDLPWGGCFIGQSGHIICVFFPVKDACAT